MEEELQAGWLPPIPAPEHSTSKYWLAVVGQESSGKTHLPGDVSVGREPFHTSAATRWLLPTQILPALSGERPRGPWSLIRFPFQGLVQRQGFVVGPTFPGPCQALVNPSGPRNALALGPTCHKHQQLVPKHLTCMGNNWEGQRREGEDRAWEESSPGSHNKAERSPWQLKPEHPAG